MSMLLVDLYEVSRQFKGRTLLVLFGRVINKHSRMNTSINLESLTETPQQNAYTRKQIDI